MSTLWLTIIALGWIAVLIVAGVGWQLLRQNGRLLLRLEELEQRLNELEFGEPSEPEGLPLCTEGPAFELPDLAGERKSLAQFREQPVLLVFFNPDCGFCREMMPKLAALPNPSEIRSIGRESAPSPVPENQSRLTSAATAGSPLPLIVTTGDAEQNRQLFAEHKVSCPVLLQNDGDVAKAYQAHGTPSGYLIGADGKIASKLAMGAEALLKLASQPAPELPLSPNGGEGVRRTGEGESQDLANRFGNRSLARSKIKRDGLKAGTPAPEFTLPRLDGNGDLSLSELRGKRVLLVFSSPGCGPCDKLAPELEKFHRENPELHVIMIGKGEPAENRAKVKAHSLTFPIVLQQQWEISRRYAMFATPIAYLIDERGVIARDLAVGSDAILDLLALEDRASESPKEIVVA